VIQTALVMVVVSIISTIIAVGNNILSVQVGEGMARDLLDAKGFYHHLYVSQFKGRAI